MRFLKDTTTEELIQWLENFTDHWHLNSQGSDHRCEFCGKTADKNYGVITHRSDCNGIRLLEELRNSHDASKASREPPPKVPAKPIIES